MFTNFQKLTPALRPSADRLGTESFTYGVTESVMLPSAVGGNRVSSNQGHTAGSLGPGRGDDGAYGPTAYGTAASEGVRVPVLEHLGI